MDSMTVLPDFLTIHILASECPCGECPAGIPVVEIPGNGPYGSSVRGFSFWTEYYPS